MLSHERECWYIEYHLWCDLECDIAFIWQFYVLDFRLEIKLIMICLFNASATQIVPQLDQTICLW